MAAQADLRAGRAAVAERRWRDAYEAFGRSATRAELSGADLWSYALSALLIGREAEFFRLLELAYDTHNAGGEIAEAARCAIWLGLRLASGGEVGAATGWLSRAARLVERIGDCVEQGYLLLPSAQQQLAHGDADAAFRTAREAVALAERFHDADLLALSLYLEGRARIAQGHVDEGVALLDEAMIDVASHRLSPQVTGLVYCSVIGACRNIYELRRAQEWTAALRDWCREQQDMLAFTGECTSYRAEIENLHGNWRGAIDEASAVCERDPSFDAAAVAGAFYQVGEARRMLGELDAAEEAYRAAARLGREPQPGLALLRLAQGQPTAAASSLQRALAERRDPLQRARLLPALCDILLALGDTEASQRACSELDEIARRIPAEALTTIAACVRGAVLLTAGDAGAALAELRAALHGWQAVGAPYEAARVRLRIADACRALGDEEGAALELEQARAAFSELGASIDVARIDVARIDEPSAPDLPGGLTAREAEVLAVIATGRSNRAAGAHLGISEKTIARHLSNIYGKLGVSSRSAATAYAWEHHLQLPPA